MRVGAGHDHPRPRGARTCRRSGDQAQFTRSGRPSSRRATARGLAPGTRERGGRLFPRRLTRPAPAGRLDARPGGRLTAPERVREGFPMASLRILNGSLEGQDIELNPDPMTVGRASSCNIKIGDAGVSSKHAKIWCEDGVFYLMDLGSTNGTFVNDRDVDREQLNDGDTITFGMTKAQFVADQPKPRAAPPVAAGRGAGAPGRGAAAPSRAAAAPPR